MKEYKIAAIAGDGIGKEVVPEGLKVLKEVSKQHQFKLQFDEFNFSSCEYYKKNGKMLPDAVSYTHLTLPTTPYV